MNKHYRVCARAIFYLCQAANEEGSLTAPKRELDRLATALTLDNAQLDAEDIMALAFVPSAPNSEVDKLKEKYPHTVQFMMTLPF